MIHGRCCLGGAKVGTVTQTEQQLWPPMVRPDTPVYHVAGQLLVSTHTYWCCSLLCSTVVHARLWCMLLVCLAAVPMSVDHKPNTREERTRIEDAGGVVVWAGTWRVGGVLAVSRAFGDRPLKRFVIPTPDVRDEVITVDDDCLILASDGLWDVVSNQVRVCWASWKEHTGVW